MVFDCDFHLIYIYIYISLDLRPIEPLIPPTTTKGLNIFAHYNQSLFGDEFSTLGDPPKKQFIIDSLCFHYKILKNFWKKMLQNLPIFCIFKAFIITFLLLGQFSRRLLPLTTKSFLRCLLQNVIMSKKLKKNLDNNKIFIGEKIQNPRKDLIFFLILLCSHCVAS